MKQEPGRQQPGIPSLKGGGDVKSDYEIRTVALVVNKKCCAIFDDSATRVEIVDEAAGEFVEVRQHASTTNGLIGITPEEWPVLREAIDRLISECRASPE